MRVSIYVRDSKAETGYLGLKAYDGNYMNSFLQVLYHIPFFRNLVYQFPAGNDDNNNTNLQTLQQIFYSLQFGNRSVSTREIEHVFGWKGEEVGKYVIDVERIFEELFGKKLNDDKNFHLVERMFQGKLKQNNSGHEESFLSISLDLEGCNHIMASIEDFTTLKNESNKYSPHYSPYYPPYSTYYNSSLSSSSSHSHGSLGCRFSSLPPVLFLQLKLFKFWNGLITSRFRDPSVMIDHQVNW